MAIEGNVYNLVFNKATGGYVFNKATKTAWAASQSAEQGDGHVFNKATGTSSSFSSDCIEV